MNGKIALFVKASFQQAKSKRNLAASENFITKFILLWLSFTERVISQMKKTQKGNSYAIVKFSDLKSVFELFIFSDLLELNRDIIRDGNSLILNLSKNTTEENNRFKKINVKNLSSLSSMINKPIQNIEIKINAIREYCCKLINFLSIK